MKSSIHSHESKRESPCDPLSSLQLGGQTLTLGALFLGSFVITLDLKNRLSLAGLLKFTTKESWFVGSLGDTSLILLPETARKLLKSKEPVEPPVNSSSHSRQQPLRSTVSELREVTFDANGRVVIPEAFPLVRTNTQRHLLVRGCGHYLTIHPLALLRHANEKETAKELTRRLNAQLELFAPRSIPKGQKGSIRASEIGFDPPKVHLGRTKAIPFGRKRRLVLGSLMPQIPENEPICAVIHPSNRMAWILSAADYNRILLLIQDLPLSQKQIGQLRRELFNCSFTLKRDPRFGRVVLPLMPNLRARKGPDIEKYHAEVYSNGRFAKVRIVPKKQN